MKNRLQIGVYHQVHFASLEDMLAVQNGKMTMEESQIRLAEYSERMAANPQKPWCEVTNVDHENRVITFDTVQ